MFHLKTLKKLPPFSFKAQNYNIEGCVAEKYI